MTPKELLEVSREIDLSGVKAGDFLDIHTDNGIYMYEIDSVGSETKIITGKLHRIAKNGTYRSMFLERLEGTVNFDETIVPICLKVGMPVKFSRTDRNGNVVTEITGAVDRVSVVKKHD